MINANSVTDFNRSTEQLLEFWLFCLFVRGKNADVQAQKLDAFLTQIGGLRSLLSAGIPRIEGTLRSVKAGQYGTLTKAIDQTMLRLMRWPLFLNFCTAEELEEIDGVGPKTSRFFLLHSREDARVAALDTHILQFLGQSIDGAVPRSTPASAGQYAKLEKAFLEIADAEGVSPAVMDLAIWRASRDQNALAWRQYV